MLIFISTWFKSRKIRSWKLVDKASVQRHIADARVWCEELIGNGQSDRKQMTAIVKVRSMIKEMTNRIYKYWIFLIIIAIINLIFNIRFYYTIYSRALNVLFQISHKIQCRYTKIMRMCARAPETNEKRGTCDR